MFVARNRQRPREENAFAKRARAKREAATPAEAPPAPMLDVSGEVSKQGASAAEAVEADAEAVAPAEPTARRGRPRSAAVEERNAKVLELVRNAGADGISKPKIATALEEKEQQVYTSLRQLSTDGLVENRNVPEAGEYRWFVAGA